MPLLLPREESSSAGGRGRADLLRLRLTEAPDERPPARPDEGRAAPRPARRLRRLGLALAGGLLLWAGHAPLDVALAGPLALVPLLALAREVGRARSGFGWGYLAGLVFFGPLFWFLSVIDPLAWLLLTLIESLAIGAFVAGLAAWGHRPLRPVVAVVWWVALEALRSGFPFGGFSWGGLGYTQHGGGLLLPTARTLGVLGVSAACAALAAALEELLHRLRTRRLRFMLPPLAAGIAVLLVCLALTAVPVPAPTGGTVDIAAVQADDIDQTSAAGVSRTDTGRILRVAQQVLDATRPLAADPPDVTVWPENSLDGDVTDERNVELRATVDEALRLLGGRPLLANGFLRGPRPATHYNAVLLLTPDGVQGTYAKRRPVPFAEYIPGRALFDWYPALDQVSSDMVAGDAPHVFDIDGARIATVICFENTFGHLVRDQVLQGAELLVVSTNNSSWGPSSASDQHLAFTQLRAVETGRSILHAGISGISGIVDPRGGITQRTELFEPAITRADLPLSSGLTPAMHLGDLLGQACMALSALALTALILTRRRPARPPR